MPYLIDGHNLIHYLNDITLDDPDDEAKLVLKLRGFCARSGKKCVVVFDHGLPGGTSSLSTTSVKVVFASAYQSNADRIIRERIRLTRDIKGWIVVSSDNEILDEARRVGMRGLKSIEFSERLERPEEDRPHRGLQDHVMVSENEIDEWMTLFDMEESSEHIPEARPTSSQPQPRIARAQEKPEPAEKAHLSPPSKPKSVLPPRIGQTEEEIDHWLQIFGEDSERQPTDKRPSNQKKKKAEDPKSPPELQAGEQFKGDTAQISKNSVEAWLDVFGNPEPNREPTDPAPQRSDPKMQGRYKSHDGKRQPTVHKRMATSDEIYLSDGEVDAWLDVFGVEDSDS